MIEQDMRKAIYRLYTEGMSKRRLARDLHINRKTICKIIAHEGELPEEPRGDKIKVDPERLKKLFEECEGQRQRVHEKLLDAVEAKEDQPPPLGYSTLTRLLREHGIGMKGDSRCDSVPDEPGGEMQHDTSQFRTKLAGVAVIVIASLIYLRYSKARYLKFYRTFNRFRMKCFFHEAAVFWGYVAPKCIIDNTNLARLRGTGSNAIIVPEMALFATRYGFKFLCHAVKHANRKAGNERSFRTVKTNFFPGREFESMEDLNAQAFKWATEIMHHRPQTKARIIPAKAFEHERSFLNKVPAGIPAPYLIHERHTDQYGCISFRTNSYWVPGKSRPKVKVLEYSDHITLYVGRKCLTEYPLPPHGTRNKVFAPEGCPAPRRHRRRVHRKKPTAQEEARLRAIGEDVGRYMDTFLKPKGIERHNMIRKLFALSRKMTEALFLKSISRALKYTITDIRTIERIAQLYVHGITESQPYAEVDEGFRNRESYIEGRLTDEPDLSIYDDFMEETDG